MVGDRPVLYLDAAAGSQVPQSVIDAISATLAAGISNLGSGYAASSVFSTEIMADARSAVADLYNCGPGEVVFGPNMTTLTFAFSRALAQTWQPGDEIVLTKLDHDANITPWVRAGADRGVTVRYAGIHDHGLNLEEIAALVGDRTRLVAVTAASNALGTTVDTRAIADLAHAAGAHLFVDAVHYAPHFPIDVDAMGADFLVSSSYKWFGPHAGMLYGREELMADLDPFKLRPSPDEVPWRWETGTQSFEALAGVTAAVDYLAGLGEGASRRERLETAYAGIGRHEAGLAERFIARLAEMPRASLHGLRQAGGRTPTFAVEVEGQSSLEVARSLGKAGVYVSHGNYYAVDVMEALGFAADGLTRFGFVHYHNADDVDRALDALEEAIV
jgi:cysteine desulfurase family protein (TIGR01976 family)